MNPDIDIAGIQRVFSAQGRQLAKMRVTTADQRIAKLARLQQAIQAHFKEAITALASDLGKPPFEAVFDIGATFAEIGEVSANLAQWMAPTPVTLGPRAAPGATARVIREPRGRILIFGPWNFPFSLLFQPLVGAIAAGNTAVLKPSEMAPATAGVAARIVRECFEESEVALFEGGPEIASALLDLPFEHIFFTGSTNVGRRVLTAAGRHLSSVTLELGGKCPVVIDEGVDLVRAAGRIAWGKFLNAGQICLAPDHVWIKADQRDAFAAAASDYVRSSYFSDGEFNRRDFARIVNERNFSRVQSLLSDAVARGARIICGGNSDGLQLAPTILTHVPRDCALMREEIFAPILPILTYEDTNDAVNEINSRDKPLALYIFSDRHSFIDDILSRTSSGGVTVNDVIQHAAEYALPFGGIGASGMGAYHGVHSFRELSHARSVYMQAPVNPAETMMRPPYGDRLPM